MPRGRGRGGRGGGYDRGGRMSNSPSGRPRVVSPTSEREGSQDGEGRRRSQMQNDVPQPKRERYDPNEPTGSDLETPEVSHGSSSDLSRPAAESELNLEEILREKKFSHRARLFIASIHDMSHNEFRDLFRPYGEMKDAHVVKEKGIGFITLGFRYLAERAIRDLDGKEIRGKKILVRFSESSEAVEVTNLSDAVTNELLADAFSKFGDVAHAVVACDSRGKSLNYGIVRFENRQSVQRAIKSCSDGFYLLTASPKPVLVKEYVGKDEEEGVTEAKISKWHWVQRERSQPPRFSAPGTIEDMMAKKWMNLFHSQDRRKAELEQTFKEEKVALDKEIEQERPSFEAELLRQDLMRRKEEHLRMLEQIQQQEDMLKSSPAGPVDSQSGRGLLNNPPINNPPMGSSPVPPLLPGSRNMGPKIPLAPPFRPPMPMEPPMHRGLKPPYRGPPRKY